LKRLFNTLFLISLLFCYSATAIAISTPRILVVHAYSQEYPWTKSQHDGFVNTIKKSISSTIIKVEYLDTKRVPADARYFERYASFIINKYRDFDPQAIYVTDDNGLLFAVQYLGKYFPDTPVFFSGVNDYSIQEQLNPERITGVFEKKEIVPNLDILQDLFGSIGHIVVIGDNSTTYQAIKHEIKNELKQRNEMQVSFIADQHLENILEQLRSINRKIILLTTLGALKTPEGQSLTLEQSISLLSSVQNAVIITMEDAYLYDAVLGGYVTSGSAQGEKAASLMLKYFKGTPLEQLTPITKSPNEYIFNDIMLQKLGLELPDSLQSAKILHPRTSLYQKYRVSIIVLLIFLATAVAFILTLYALVTSKKNKELNAQSKLLKQQGMELKESEEKYRLLFERSEDPMLLIFGEQFILANKAVGKLLGYASSSEFLQIHPSKISPEIQPDGQNSRVKANNMLQIAYDTGYNRFEWQHLKADGTPLLIEVSLTRIPYKEQYALFCVWRDITALRQTEIALKEKSTYLNSMLSASVNVGFIATDEDLQINYYNDVSAKMFGLNPEMLENQNISFFHSQNNVPEDRLQAMLNKVRTDGEYRFPMTLPINNKVRHIDSRISAIYDDAKQLKGYLLMTEDFTRQHEAEELIKYQAAYDCLTNLPNRRTFMERLDQAVANCKRLKHFGAVLFIDLDNFKNINDTLGHTIGDELLKSITTRMKQSIRREDTIARLGGDEFVLLLFENYEQQDTAINQARKVSEKLLNTITSPFTIEANVIHTTFSIGISIFPEKAADDADTILRKADTAMYQAKDSGRNNFKFFSPEMHKKVEEKMHMLDMLHIALQEKQFQVYFQPQFNQQEQLIGAESLIRWHHPKRGTIFPDQFITLSEESGLIGPISHFVSRASLETQQQWARQAADKTRLRLSINVSAIQFKQDGFVDNIIQILNDTNADPNYLTLELTESMLIENIDQTIKKMQALNKLGIQFSIDDFGTGYSSLAYLKQLPISEIKIDRSFVKDIITDENDFALVNTIITLSRQLNINVVAEGVENKAIQNRLLESGCEIFQGYYFDKPLAKAEFEAKYIKQ
jgi:diguanylate cyclase (GGDEF)-like protein/PAS domain S-box-containing protein